MVRKLTLLLVIVLVTVQPSNAQQRSVVVVYDDSGSMNEDGSGRWWFANYATQVLGGLLEPTDELALVRMSRAQNIERVDLGDRQAFAQGFRDQSVPAADTPYEAVRTAMSALRGLQGDEKWLVVITDGAFNDTLQVEATEQDVQSFIQETGARTIFLLIGENQSDVAELTQGTAVDVWRREAQAEVLQALGRSDIVTQMQRIAAQITSRAFGAGPTISVSDSAVAVQSLFPLQRLTLFQQTPSPSVLSRLSGAETQEGTLDNWSSVDVRMPPDGMQSVPLYGRITHLSEDQRGEVIEEGRLQLYFEGSVDPSTIEVLPEVAARLDVQVVGPDGRPVPAEQSRLRPCLDEPIEVRATLISTKGDTILAGQSQPGNITTQAIYRGGSEAMQYVAPRGFFSRQIELNDTPFTLSVSASYPGYFNFKSDVLTVDPEECIRRVIDVKTTSPWSSDVLEMSEAEPAEVIPLVNGQPVSPQEFENWSLDATDSPATDYVDIERGDSTWTIRPRHVWGLPQLTQYFRPDSFNVAVTAESGTPREAPRDAELTFRIHSASFWALWGTFIVTLLVLVAALIYLYGLVIKRRFPRGSSMETITEASDGIRHPGESESLPTRWANRWLVPFIPERRNVEGITFEAGYRPSQVIIPASEIHSNMSIGDTPLVREEKQAFE